MSVVSFLFPDPPLPPASIPPEEILEQIVRGCLPRCAAPAHVVLNGHLPFIYAGGTMIYDTQLYWDITLASFIRIQSIGNLLCTTVPFHALSNPYSYTCCDQAQQHLCNDPAPCDS